MISKKRQCELIIELFVVWATWAIKSGTKKQIVKKAENLAHKYRDLTIDSVLNTMSDKGVPCRLIQSWIDTTELKNVLEFKTYTFH